MRCTPGGEPRWKRTHADAPSATADTWPGDLMGGFDPSQLDSFKARAPSRSRFAAVRCHGRAFAAATALTRTTIVAGLRRTLGGTTAATTRRKTRMTTTCQIWRLSETLRREAVLTPPHCAERMVLRTSTSASCCTRACGARANNAFAPLPQRTGRIKRTNRAARVCTRHCSPAFQARRSRSRQFGNGPVLLRGGGRCGARGVLLPAAGAGSRAHATLRPS